MYCCHTSPLVSRAAPNLRGRLDAQGRYRRRRGEDKTGRAFVFLERIIRGQAIAALRKGREARRSSGLISRGLVIVLVFFSFFLRNAHSCFEQERVWEDWQGGFVRL